MKKFLSFILISLLTAGISTANAQYEKGQVDLNIGAGIGATFGAGTGTLPPLSLGLDFGLNDNISLGAYVGYYGTEQEIPGGKWSYSYLIVGGRGAYHFDLVDKLDTYAGVMLGYNIASVEWDGAAGGGLVTPSVGGVAYSGFAGARYHFGNTFGLFGEVGYGIAYLTAGIAFKF